jgi:hypothetical protein
MKSAGAAIAGVSAAAFNRKISMSCRESRQRLADVTRRERIFWGNEWNTSFCCSGRGGQRRAVAISLGAPRLNGHLTPAGRVTTLIHAFLSARLRETRAREDFLVERDLCLFGGHRKKRLLKCRAAKQLFRVTLATHRYHGTKFLSQPCSKLIFLFALVHWDWLFARLWRCQFPVGANFLACRLTQDLGAFFYWLKAISKKLLFRPKAAENNLNNFGNLEQLLLATINFVKEKMHVSS